MAMRGWGNIMIEATAVVPEGRITPEDSVSPKLQLSPKTYASRIEFCG